MQANSESISTQYCIEMDSLSRCGTHDRLSEPSRDQLTPPLHGTDMLQARGIWKIRRESRGHSVAQGALPILRHVHLAIPILLRSLTKADDVNHESRRIELFAHRGKKLGQARQLNYGGGQG